MKSKRQQRFLFKVHPEIAHAVARRGTAFKALPERVTKRRSR
ncbi:MAG: hypothetical protein WKF94_12960 [Solirubrobacteraceae bacterium]